MKFRSKRLLNKKSNFLGLSEWDLAFLGYELVFLYSILGILGLEIFSFVIFFGSALLLIQIRLRNREKVIGDYFRHLIQRISL